MRVDAPASRDPGSPARSARRRRPSLLWLAGGALLTLSACQRDEVAHFRVPKAPPSQAFAPVPASAGMGADMAGEVPPPPSPTGASALTWTLPKGWSESRGGGGGMRYATLSPPASAPAVDVSVVVLPGPAGGELANVNRWRGQIGLAPLDDAGLGQARKVVQTRAGSLSLYDFASEGQKPSRVVAGFTSADGNTWFVKMSGDADAVGANRAAFVNLLESLRFEASN